MTTESVSSREIPLFFARSHISTEINKTGTWRFVKPRYDEKTAPCSAACPVGTDIARVEMQITRGLFEEAGKTVLRENPFPAVCGHVCFHPCETSCNRSGLNEPIPIQHLERRLGDTLLLNGVDPAIDPSPVTGKKVAIVGAGPAGLSAAYFLITLGYDCSVFDAQPEPGGLLRWGIPGFRLPGLTLKGEIQRIERLGVSIKSEAPINQNDLEDIKGRFDAIFIGCGYARPLKMNIPGEEAAFDGLEFLYRLRQNRSVVTKGTSAVIGGGNTAIDVARSLVRMGTKPILVYRRRREDMPAFVHEVDMTVKEGVEIMELVAPLQIAQEKGACVMTLQQMKIVGKEPSGRARVVPDGSKVQRLRVGNVFTAIGAEAEKSWYLASKTAQKRLKLSHTRFIVDDLPMIYGGDLTNEKKSVADAIASGKQAAITLDIYFKKGWDVILEHIDACQVGAGPSLSMEIYLGGDRKKRNRHIVSFDEINTDYFTGSLRVIPTPADEKKEAGLLAGSKQMLAQETVMKEAERCFNCGICNDCDNCRLFCPEMAVSRGETRQINLDYCKGCGICITECPRSAITLEEENK